MASLQITYSELRREIGRFLGYGRDPSSWVALSAEEVDVADCLRSGMRSFYWPAGSTSPWSFLRKLATVVTVVGTSTYTLPTDFGGTLTGLTFSASSGKTPVTRISDEEIRALQSGSNTNGVPTTCALRVVQPTPGSESDYQIVLHPPPDAIYTLSYRYSIEPPEIDATNIYPLGSSVHAETILEACLAAAEKTLDDDGDGVHARKFDACLRASLAIDAEMQ